MNSLYNFFDNTFCAEDCTNYMDVILIDKDADSDPVIKYDTETIPSNNLTSKFKAEYHICRCDHGLAALRCGDSEKEYCDPNHCHVNYHYDFGEKSCKANECNCLHGAKAKLCPNEIDQFCDPDGCDTDNGYQFDGGSKICVKVNIDKSLLCAKTEHYVSETDTCEPNVCYCSYGPVADTNCVEHEAHICKASSCYGGTEASQGEAGHTICSKPCETILFMDETWSLVGQEDNQIYWQLITAPSEIGYTFFEALDYCSSIGTYVSLPSHPEYFKDILGQTDSNTWIGLSKFGDVPDNVPYHTFCEAEDILKWERSNKTYFGDSVNNVNSRKITDCCVEIFSNDDGSTVSKRLVDCNKRVSSFICEYSLTDEESQTGIRKTHAHYQQDKFKFVDFNDPVNNPELNRGFNYRYYSLEKTWHDAKAICESEGYYLAEITSLDSLNMIREVVGNDQTFWTGGKYVNAAGSNNCPNNPPDVIRFNSKLSDEEVDIEKMNFVWDHSGQKVYDTIDEDDGLSIVDYADYTSYNGCCFSIYKDDNYFSNYGDCGRTNDNHNSVMNFLCQRAGPQIPQLHCNLCQPGYIWKDSVCQLLKPNLTPVSTSEQQFWESKTVCRCSYNPPEQVIAYGLDCLNERDCTYVYDPEDVKEVYGHVYSTEIDTGMVDEFKSIVMHENSKHQDTENLQSMIDCDNEYNCVKKINTNIYKYKEDLITRGFYLNGDMNENFILSRYFKNYFYIEYLKVGKWIGDNRWHISSYFLFNLPNLKRYYHWGSSNKILKKNYFISNRQLKSIDFRETEIEAIEEQAFDAFNLEIITIVGSKLKTVKAKHFQFQNNLKALDLWQNKLNSVDSKVFANLKKLERLTLIGNVGTVMSKKKDEKKQGACTCKDQESPYDECYLPDSVKNDFDRAPSCYIKRKKGQT